MKPIAAAILAAVLSLVALTAPLAAQTLTVLLPSVTFPDGTVTLATRGQCAVKAAPPACKTAE